MSAHDPESRRPLHRNVWVLGWTSLLNDASSEMVIPVLPMFITGMLKASVASLGIIEGVAESAASLLRLGTGALSDRVGRRKPFIVFGYGLSALARAGFAMANAWQAVLGLRFSDRLGKAVRTPARDALLADSLDPRDYGRGFGLHKSMDTLGAIVGPIAAFVLLSLFPGDYRRVFLYSIVPGALSVLVLLLFVRAVEHAPAAFRGWRGEWRALSAPFRRFLFVDALFRLGSSSLAFVLLRAHDAGFAAAHVPLVYLVYNVVFAGLSYPLGHLSDRTGRRRMIVWGYVLFAGTYALFALAATPALIVVGLALLGAHSALIEGQQRGLVADLVASERRGTAYGLYHLMVGVALLPASIMAGALWDRFGASVAFLADAGLALVAAALFVLLLPPRDELRERHAVGNAG